MSHYICSLDQSGREALIFCLCDTRSMQKNLQMYFASESKSTDYVNPLTWGDSAMKSTDMGLRVSIRKKWRRSTCSGGFQCPGQIGEIPVEYYLMSLIGPWFGFPGTNDKIDFHVRCDLCVILWHRENPAALQGKVRQATAFNPSARLLFDWVWNLSEWSNKQHSLLRLSYSLHNKKKLNRRLYGNLILAYFNTIQVVLKGNYFHWTIWPERFKYLGLQQIFLLKKSVITG